MLQLLDITGKHNMHSPYSITDETIKSCQAYGTLLSSSFNASFHKNGSH